MTIPLTTLLNQLTDLDHQLFRQVNQQWTTDWMDSVFVWLREPNHWIPFYIGLAGLAIWTVRSGGLSWLLLGVLAVVASDLVGNYGFKHVFDRLRPCNDPALQTGLRLLVEKCGGGYSFVSNHATNHMSLAVFLAITLHKRIGHWGWIFIAWAFGIAYAQVYVGLHFPADVLAGALLGGIIGGLVGRSFNQQYKNGIFPTNQSIE
jgi:membrane-associated phospholipid phosphatase